MMTPANEIDNLLRRDARRLTLALLGVAAAHVTGRGRESAFADLFGYVTTLLAAGDLLGRRRVLLASKALGANVYTPAPSTPFTPTPPAPPVVLPPGAGGPLVPDGRGIPKIDFPEAVANLELRQPRLLGSIPGEGTVAERMGRIYAEGGFSLARAAEQETVARVQAVLADAMRRGVPSLTTQQVVAEMGPWTRSYANTVWRNNLNTAYTAGVFEQMNDPDVQSVIGALAFDAVTDSDTTPICKACDGTVGTPGDLERLGRVPPMHHNCRSSVRFVDYATLRRMGLLKDGRVVSRVPNPDVTAAPGFGHRRGLRLSP